MPRLPRLDVPGMLLHVISRGQEGMAVFRRPEDYRFFLALLALAVRRGGIEIDAFVLLENHFHLLVQSLVGDVSGAMQWVLGRYSAYFNCKYGHTGHVFERRFWSCPVQSLRYRRTLMRYIDLNPVRAGAAATPFEYRYGSAVRHVAHSRRPLWLSRRLVNEFMERAPSTPEERMLAYRRAFGLHDVFSRSQSLVEARLACRPQVRDDLDLLCQADGATWAKWFADRSGVSACGIPALPMADARSILEAVDAALEAVDGITLRRPSGRPLGARRVFLAGLLRDLGGLGQREIGEALGVSRAYAGERLADHRRSVREVPEYVCALAEIARCALARCLRELPEGAP